MIHLIIGGARSGKSAFAEKTVLNQAAVPVYIATATALDNEMQSRIAHHQQLRSSNWQLMECPLALDKLLLNEAQYINQGTPRHYLIDCLTLWLNNIIYQYDQQLLASNYEPGRVQYEKISAGIENTIADFIEQLSAFKNTNVNITLVSNEVGLGIIPLGIISRLFLDHCGRLNQKVAQLADRVTLITAGLPLDLKSPQQEL
ncbi:MAG: adenosylcobinamide kinase/adenosylcobinamide-phosphate guanylyltransferase [Psychromonas sp.]|jgi:adenosylcobinamide kinase/adenosylcobinamide-phosphate guanylyltransferase|uniref:bifunctional adenosylcobinamide kinase/adenosylcobinamide-phosphate guanylyltransferase n=1 Tax=Psychromonas sp. TaxID=1884585 RepID=UPI0039E2E61E